MLIYICVFVCYKSPNINSLIIFFYLKRLIHQNLELDTVELTLPHEYTVRYLLRRAIHIWLLYTLYPEIKWDRPCSSSFYNNHQHVKSKNHSSKYNILIRAQGVHQFSVYHLELKGNPIYISQKAKFITYKRKESYLLGRI